MCVSPTLNAKLIAQFSPGGVRRIVRSVFFCVALVSFHFVQI